MSFGIALKSKLSRLLVAGSEPSRRHRFKLDGERSLDAALHYPPRAVDQLQLDQAAQEPNMVQPLGCAPRAGAGAPRFRYRLRPPPGGPACRIRAGTSAA